MRRSNNKFAKKAICWILSLAMVVVFIPFSSFAAENDSTPEVEASGIIDQLPSIDDIEKIGEEAWGKIVSSISTEDQEKISKALSFIGDLITNPETQSQFWAKWEEWAKAINKDLSSNYPYWPGIQNYSGKNVKIAEFESMGSEAMTALAEMLLFVPSLTNNGDLQVDAGVNSKKISLSLVKKLENWDQMEKLIEELGLPYYEGPTVTIQDIEWMTVVYSNLDWKLIFKYADFNPKDYAYNKLTKTWPEISFVKFKQILVQAQKEGGEPINLNYILPVWNWQGKYPLVDWVKEQSKIDSWDDLIETDFVEYLKDLKFPEDSLKFFTTVPQLEALGTTILAPASLLFGSDSRVISSVTAEPVKAKDNAIRDGILENIGQVSLADDNGFVVFDENGKAKVLYRVTVKGTPGTSFTLSDETSKLTYIPVSVHGVPEVAQNLDGSITGYIPLGHLATQSLIFYVAKDYTTKDVKAADKYSKYNYLPLDYTVTSKTGKVKAAEGPEGMAYIAGDMTKLVYVLNGGTPEYAEEAVQDNSEVTINKYPFKAGYTFTGWYLDEDCKTPVKNNIVKIEGVTKVYAGWTVTPVPEWLNGTDHNAYLIGYSDGTVKPAKAITRAEAATIFFRLLKDKYRTQYLTTSNKFTDVKSGDWYNTAVSTLAAMGVIQGRTLTTFAPNEKITRAEFVTMCARFDTTVNSGASNLTDIENSWAKAYINKAYTLGWVNGYTDMTFIPAKDITRAEVATIVNRILHRLPTDKNALINNMIKWPDNAATDWYYLAIQEATNSHTAKYDTETTETWVAIEKGTDWAQYQK